MITPFAGVLSALLVLAGVLCLYEYTLYDATDRAAAPVRSRLYLASVLLITLLGIGGVVALATATVPPMTVLGIIGITAALPAFAQYLFHQELELDSGPLASRVADRWF
ncbi:sodium:proton antiporter [Natrialba sp. SSL1]|uniref:sodium:proton antiporter n=1 Tax=Natrialba sp. SSL1 TaxID=1869245 RepID=UPI0008F7FF17|nr:sodium:proton antiporter [Natrialba sp. SSL1]OIB59345.1 sodium:proton antiporter [Natrialba sp. SSL1]